MKSSSNIEKIYTFLISIDIYYLVMEKDIVGYIVSSLEAWRDNEKVGEEVRMLQPKIDELTINDYYPTLEAILTLIDNFPDDFQLGQQMRKIYIPLKVYYEDKTITL